MKHTWNVFKDEVNAMTEQEKKDLLTDLRTELIVAKQRRFENDNSMLIHNLKREIAYLKTVLHVKGFHFNPRK